MEKQRRRKKGLHILVEGDYFWEDHGKIYTITRPLNEMTVECDLGEKIYLMKKISVLRHIRDSSLVQTLSHVRLFATPWTSACQASLSITNSLTLLKTHVYWISDAIQPPHPLLSPSLPAFNLSQHQSLFQWVSSSHQMAKVLEFQLQHLSFQWIFRTDFL